MPNETKKSLNATGALFDSTVASTSSSNDIHPPEDGVAAARIEPRVISVRGAREHNLDDVSIDLPRDRLVVLTGLSGSSQESGHEHHECPHRCSPPPDSPYDA